MIVFLTVILLLWPQWKILAEEIPPPSSPAEFHEQEFQRILSGLDERATENQNATQNDYDVVYYDLTLDTRDYADHIIYGTLSATVRVTAHDVNQLVFDLCSSLTVDSVSMNGIHVGFSFAANTLIVSLNRLYVNGEMITATVNYHGTPCNTNLYPSFTYFTHGGGVPGIATLSEPYGARDWWPSKNVPDDKADSVRVHIICADTLTGTSNGILESVTPLQPSSRIFTWFEKHRIAAYLICVNVTNYLSFSDWYLAQNGDSVPVVYYTYPEKLNQAQISWDVVPDMMSYFSSLYGEYPFSDEKYGHTMFSFVGGMEHQCNTSYGANLTGGNHFYDFITAHELGHQWYGDCVTLQTWPDIWLNEGFACLSEALWFEHVAGPAAYRNYMTNSGLRVTDPSGPVYNPNALFSANTVYHKGAWILHMLRGVVGNDSLFFAVMQQYRHRHEFRNATTAEFLADASEIIGYDVTPYLYAYLYRTNRPVFEVSYGSGVLDGESRTVVRINQVQTDPDTTFHTRLDLEFGGEQDVTERVENANWHERYYFGLGYTPVSLMVDPRSWVLKQVNPVPLATTVLNTELAPAYLGESYTDTLFAIGGNSGYAWHVISSTPPGLFVSGQGVVTGVPFISGDYVLTVAASDNTGQSDTAQVTITVARPPLLAPWNLTTFLIAPQLVQLRWAGASPADSFRVYRATRGDFSDARLIGTVATKYFFDSLAVQAPGDSSTIGRYYYVTSVQY